MKYLKNKSIVIALGIVVAALLVEAGMHMYSAPSQIATTTDSIGSATSTGTDSVTAGTNAQTTSSSKKTVSSGVKTTSSKTTTTAGANQPFPKEGVDLRLDADQLVVIPNTNLYLKVLDVIDLTSKGCVGGFEGCPDRTDLVLYKNYGSTTVQNINLKLFSPLLPTVKEDARDIGLAFGYSVRLMALKDTSIVLHVARTP